MSLSDRTPGGAQTRSKQHAVFGGPPFPQTVRASRGARVWAGGEDDDKPYLDWMSALASVGLGYAYPYVDDAVRNQIERNGVALPLPSRLEYIVADLICDTLKWPDQVRFVKTGSEATAAAMMIARRATGRKKIISIGYHGWHEAHLPSENLVDVPWGYYLHQNVLTPEIAAVIVEPMRDHETVPYGEDVDWWLKGIQALCKENGALFILDEMVTGFRWAIGGASEFFSITPDLACYGKAMGNGYPIACVVGSRKLMKHAHDVSSTYGGECVGLAAAKATIEVYRREPVIARLWEVGRALQAGCPSLTGYPVHPVFKMGEDWTTSERAIPIVQYAATKGVLIHPAGVNPTYSHSDADVQRTIEVINEAVSTL